MDVLYQHGRKLVGNRTAKSRWNVMRVTEYQFADNVALYTRSRRCLEYVAKKFVEGVGEWRLTVSIEKIKAMTVGEKLDDDDTAPLQVEDGEIKIVEQLTYLGSVMSKDGDVMEDVKGRVAKAPRVFGCLRNPTFTNPTLCIPTKRTMYKVTVLAMLLYGAEAWTVKAEHVRHLNSSPNHCVRVILGITRNQQWKQRVMSKFLASWFGLDWSILDFIMDSRLQWLGHLGLTMMRDCRRCCLES